MYSSHRLLSRYDVVVCDDWKYMKIIELDFAMVANAEHVSSIDTNDMIEPNVSLASFGED